MLDKIRVRFAPSPTGFMHLGNIRTALINYLFAHQKKGEFIVRIEDTDKSRNLDEAGYAILEDLKWLGLKYNEGPVVGGKFGPYFQSERTEIYKKNLDDLILNQKVYRCFCTLEELERVRKEQLSQGLPPRYNRRCLHLSDDQIKQKLAIGIPFVWRFEINQDEEIEIEDMTRGKVKFEMKNFSDFILMRQDGSFTFMFTNFVDDWLMKITHVIRGEDHLSNSAVQAALFHALAVKLPTFWHLPMLCSKNGKKMSKRDFGFSLEDLKYDGFLPHAICNYLAIIGGSFENEILSLGELVEVFKFENMHSTGAIKFDIEKLNWINHKWIERFSAEKLLPFVKPFLHDQLPESQTLDDEILKFILEKIKSDLKSLKDVGPNIEFYFHAPEVSKEELENKIGQDKSNIILKLIHDHINDCDKTDLFLEILKSKGKEKGLKIKEIFWPLRYLLTGNFSGQSVHDLFEILPDEQIRKRLSAF